MPSTLRTATMAAYAFVVLPMLSAMAMAQAAPNEMDSHLQKRTQYAGCFSSSTPLTMQGTWTYQSQGYCSGKCSSSAVYAMSGSNGNECWCGSQLPAAASLVDDSKCSAPCPGYPQQNCGAQGFYSVWVSGSLSDATNYGGSTTSSSVSSSKSGTATTDPVVVTSTTGGQTIVVTVPASAAASATGGSSGGGSNTAGIAAGVVVGVVAIAGIIAGIYFFMRHKRRREAEEDFKQRTQVDNFMRSASERKPPGTSYSGMSDQRLDPEAGRRNSVGSLADNHDYSRRILRVANPSID